MRILIVDDDHDLREGVAEALEAEGHTVLRAANGREALLALKKDEPPAVILLDLLMPVMNGWQFCQAKKADQSVASIPIIAMSGAASKDPASPYYIDVDDVIPKPLELADLLGKLNDLASRSAPRA